MAMMEAPHSRSEQLLDFSVEIEEMGADEKPQTKQTIDFGAGSLGSVMMDLHTIEIPSGLPKPSLNLSPQISASKTNNSNASVHIPSGNEVDLDIMKMSIEHERETEARFQQAMKRNLPPKNPAVSNPTLSPSHTPAANQRNDDSKIVQENNAPIPPGGPSAPPPSSQPSHPGPEPGDKMMSPQTKKNPGEVHLCAHCSREVDIINGFDTRDYKSLSACGCYAHMRCLIETKGQIACVNCVCVGCDIPGAVTYRTGIQKNVVDGRLAEITVYPKKISACGCHWHQPCYDNFTKLKTEKQDRGLAALSFTKCLICLPDEYALGEMPPIFGPNYMRTHGNQELALYRKTQGRREVERKLARKAEKKRKREELAELEAKKALERESKETTDKIRPVWLQPSKPKGSSVPPGSFKAFVSTRSAIPPPPHNSPAPTMSVVEAEPADDQPAKREQKSFYIPDGEDSDSDSEEEERRKGAAKIIVVRTPGDKFGGGLSSGHGNDGRSTETYGQRLYHTKMTLAHLNNMGFVLQDFADHLTAEQFFLRFFDVPIITKIIRVRTTSLTNGASVKDLIELWPSLSMNNIVGGIKGLKDRPPTKNEAMEEVTRVVLSDLLELKLTTPLMVKMGLTSSHIVSTEPVALWKSAFPDLEVNRLGSWMDHPENLFDAGLITEEERDQALRFNAERDERLKAQNRSWLASTLIAAYEMSPNAMMRQAHSDFREEGTNLVEEESYKNLTPSLTFNAKRRDKSGFVLPSIKGSSGHESEASAVTSVRKFNFQPKVSNGTRSNRWVTRRMDDL